MLSDQNLRHDMKHQADEHKYESIIQPYEYKKEKEDIMKSRDLLLDDKYINENDIVFGHHTIICYRCL